MSSVDLPPALRFPKPILLNVVDLRFDGRPLDPSILGMGNAVSEEPMLGSRFHLLLSGEPSIFASCLENGAFSERTDPGRCFKD